MIKEAIQLLQDTALEAAAAEVVQGLGLRNQSIVAFSGELKEFKHDVPKREHDVCSLESLATLVNGSGGLEDGESALRSKASVWHKGDIVIVVFDDSDASYRDDRAYWKLNPSKKFACLTGGDAAKPRKQLPFVEFLVENLRDELEAAAPGLLGVFRNLKFRNNNEATGNVQHGRASLGRSIEAEIAGARELPETITLRVKRWADMEYVVPVECYLKLDPVEETLALRPLADELQEAENAAQEWLHNQITLEVDVPVYYGTP